MFKLVGPLNRLEAAVKERGAGGYVVTASPTGRPHVTYAPVRWDGEGLAAEVGSHTALNARENPTVTVLFPGRGPEDYSLIVDGAARVEGKGRLLLTPTRGVFHRPGAPADPASGCSADCVPIFAPADPGVGIGTGG
jgi:hypothetical protein